MRTSGPCHPDPHSVVRRQYRPDPRVPPADRPPPPARSSRSGACGRCCWREPCPSRSLQTALIVDLEFHHRAGLGRPGLERQLDGLPGLGHVRWGPPSGPASTFDCTEKKIQRESARSRCVLAPSVKPNCRRFEAQINPALPVQLPELDPRPGRRESRASPGYDHAPRQDIFRYNLHRRRRTPFLCPLKLR